MPALLGCHPERLALDVGGSAEVGVRCPPDVSASSERLPADSGGGLDPVPNEESSIGGPQPDTSEATVLALFGAASLPLEAGHAPCPRLAVLYCEAAESGGSVCTCRPGSCRSPEEAGGLRKLSFTGLVPALVLALPHAGGSIPDVLGVGGCRFLERVGESEADSEAPHGAALS